MTTLVARDRGPRSARDRILSAADRLFYGNGIRAVGVDALVDEAQVTRVTFYRHFASKESLVEAYLRARADRGRAAVAALRAAHPDDPRATLDGIADGIADECAMLDFRGCEFINAAAEFADQSSAARRLAAEQRSWVLDVTAELLAELGCPTPRELGELLLMLRTGAFIAAALERSSTALEVFRVSWNAMIDGAVVRF